MSENLDIEFLIKSKDDPDSRGENGKDHSFEPEDLDFIVSSQPSPPHAADPDETSLDFDISEEALSLSKSLNQATEEVETEEFSLSVDSDGLPSEDEESDEPSTEFEALLVDDQLFNEETPPDSHSEDQSEATEHSLVLPEEVLRDPAAGADESDSTPLFSQEKTNFQTKEYSERQQVEPEPTEQLDPAKFKKTVGFKFDLSALISSRSSIGLDFGATSLKYIELTKNPTGIKVINCGSYSIQTSPEENKNRAVARILKERFDRRKFKKGILTTAVSGLEVWFKHIQVPAMSKSKLKKAVPWACRKDLPFPLEESRVEFYKNKTTARTDGKFDIFVVAAQEQLVTEQIELLREVNLKPAMLSTIPVALWSLFTAIDKKLPDCYGFVDIGTAFSHIAFVNEGELQFARQVATGGKSFTQAITGSIFVDGREIEMTPDKAEAVKRRYGFPDVNSAENTENDIPLKELAVMMQPVLEKLLSDIQRTRDFFEEKYRGGRVEHIYLTGGGALLKNLGEILSQELSCSVQVFNPFNFISLKKFNEPSALMEIGPRFAVAAGLALDRNKALNLLPPQMKGAFFIHNLKRASGFLVLIICLLMLFFSRQASQRITEFRQEYKQANQQYENIKPKRERFLALQKRLTSLQKNEKELKSKLEINLAAADHLKVLSNIWPNNLALTAVEIAPPSQRGPKDNPSVAGETLILEGVAFENNSREGMNLAQFIFELEELNYFTAISLKSQTIKPDGSLAFTLECEI